MEGASPHDLEARALDAIVAAGRARVAPPRVEVGAGGYGEVMARKDRLPLGLEGITSLRDFGGCYLVHGRYLLGPARALGLRLASMVDVNVLPEFEAAAAALQAEQPGLEVETIPGDFREPTLYAGMQRTDAALLYEVLLHQENYVEVVRQVTRVTDRYVCVAQPCLREDLFALPGSSTLLQFFDEPLKDLLRTGSFWPAEPAVERFTPAHWMWGQTTSHLVDVFAGLGWALHDGEVVDDVAGPWWEYPLLVFRAPH